MQRAKFRQIRAAGLVFCLYALLIVFPGCKKDKPVADDESKPSNSSIASNDVVLHAAIDVAGIVAQIEKLTPAEQKADLQYAIAMGTVKSLKLQRVEFYWVQSNKEPVPVLIASDPDKATFNALATNEVFQPLLEKTDEGHLKLKQQSGPQTVPIPAELRTLTIQSVGSNLVASTPEIIELLESEAWHPRDSQVVKLAETVRTPQSLFVFAALVQKLDELTKQKAPTADPSVLTLDLTNPFADESGPLFQPTVAVAGSFAFTGDDGREIRFLQQFADEKSSQAAQSWLGETPMETLPDNLGDKLRLALAHDGLNKTVERDGATVSLRLNWNSSDDEEIVRGISAATIGHVFGKGLESGIAASDGPIVTEYTVAPELTESVDVATLEKQFADELGQRLFFHDAFAQPDNAGSIHLSLDPVFFPNAHLATARHTIKSVLTTDGQDVLDRDDEEVKQTASDRGFPSIEFGNQAHYASIRLPIVGVESEKLKSAQLEITATVPTRLAVFRFDAKNGSAQVQENDEASVRVTTLDRDSVSIRYTIPSNVRKKYDDLALRPTLIAFDETGNALANDNFFFGGGSAGLKFRGLVDKLWVVLPMEVQSVSTNVTVDLNGGESPKIPDQPADNVPTRYSLSFGTAEIRSVAETELSGLEVRWRQPEFGFGGLLLQLPDGTPVTDANWETYWFGHDAPVKVVGHSNTNASLCEWTAFEGLDLAQAVVGRVKFSIPSDLEFIEFEKKADGQSLTQDASGREVSLQFNKQIVTISPAGGNVLRLRAYDGTGRALRARETGAGVSEGEEQHYFWGQATRADVVISYHMIEQTIPFEIVQGNVDPAAFAKFKSQTEQMREAAVALQQAGAELRTRTTSFDRLAGLHFLFDSDGKPLHKIPREVAEADPRGAEAFAYQTKPYHGYFVAMLEFHNRFDGQEPYRRGDEPETYTWEKGTIEAKPLYEVPALVAWPEDPTMPTLVLDEWGRMYVKQTAKPPEALPGFDALHNDWQQLELVEQVE